MVRISLPVDADDGSLFCREEGLPFVDEFLRCFDVGLSDDGIVWAD